jgi:hypothetical protein
LLPLFFGVTFAGLPWLLYLRSKCKRPIHFWPFDGWEIPQGKSAIVEVYPSLWTRRFQKEGRDGDEQTAYAVAAWLQRADLNGSLGSYFNPPLTPEERDIADRPLQDAFPMRLIKRSARSNLRDNSSRYSL